jgi:hypothetical protein
MEKETKKEGHAAVPQHIAEASDAKKRAKICKSRRTYGRRKQFINSMGSAFWKYFTVGGHYQNIKIKRKHRYKTIAL